MSRVDEIHKQLNNHRRRLQILKEQQALQGIAVDPKIPLEIQDIETEIATLEVELQDTQTADENTVEIEPKQTENDVGNGKRKKRVNRTEIIGIMLTALGVMVAVFACIPVWLPLIWPAPTPMAQVTNTLPPEITSTHTPLPPSLTPPSTPTPAETVTPGALLGGQEYCIQNVLSQQESQGKQYLGYNDQTAEVVLHDKCASGEKWEFELQSDQVFCIQNVLGQQEGHPKQYLGYNNQTAEVVLHDKCASGEKWEFELQSDQVFCIQNVLGQQEGHPKQYLGYNNQTAEMVLHDKCGSGEKWIIN